MNFSVLFLSWILVFKVVGALDCTNTNSNPILPEGCDRVTTNLVLLSISQTDLLNQFIAPNAKFSNVKEVTGYISFYDNDALTTLQGLNALTNIGGFLRIQYCDNLTSLAALNSLTTVGGDLIIGYCPKIDSLAALNSLMTVGGDLSLHHISLLTTLQGLNSVTTVGTLNIWNCDKLVSIEALDSLTTLSGSLSITDNDVLTTIAPLSSLTSVPGTLSISNNPVLETLNGLNGITGNVTNLYIYNNAKLTSLSGIGTINAVTEKLRIGYSDWNPPTSYPNAMLDCSNICTKNIIAKLKNSGTSDIHEQCNVSSSFTCPSGGSLADRDSCPYNTACTFVCAESTCTFVPMVVHRKCNDGIKDAEEECDTSSNTATECPYGDQDCQLCNSTCNLLQPRYCGDGIVDRENQEVCDDETLATLYCQYGERSCQVCFHTCKLFGTGTPIGHCGDGVVQSDFEGCDNITQCAYNTTCDVCTNCTIVNQRGGYCGDNIVDNANGELCDNTTDPFCINCKLRVFVETTTIPEDSSSVGTNSFDFDTISNFSKSSPTNLNSSEDMISFGNDPSNNNNDIDNICSVLSCRVYLDNTDITVFQFSDLVLEDDIYISGNQVLTVLNGNLSFTKDSVLNLDLEKNMLTTPINITNGCLDGKNGDLEIDIKDYDLGKDTRVDIVSYDCFVSEFDSVSIINSDNEALCFKGEYGTATYSVLLGANGQCLSFSTKFQINFKVFLVLLSFTTTFMF